MKVGKIQFEANGIIRPIIPRPIPIVFLPDQTLFISKLKVYRPSGLRLLTGGRSDLLTSSSAPFRRSGPITHSGEIQKNLNI